MTTHLLDVNVLLALSDPMHIHHDAAHHWFSSFGSTDWATCPLTENGFVRISSHPKYPNRPGDGAIVLGILRKLCAAEGHRFWSEDMSLRSMVRPGAIITHSQITDTFLLGLAIHKGGKLATFDRNIPTTVVEGGAGALEVISP